MKMLVVVDSEQYSEVAAREAAGLAVNTWADVVLCGLQEHRGVLDERLAGMVAACREKFVGEDSPYGPGGPGALQPAGDGRWSLDAGGVARKRLQVEVRAGGFRETVLRLVDERQIDLVVLGAGGEDCRQWGGDPHLPRKIAAAAPCSVLVVKKEPRASQTVTCCLDRDQVSQESLELVTQFVTLHQATLEIVGLAGAKGLQEGVEKAMNVILRYYTRQGVQARVRAVVADELAGFAARAAEHGLVALWYGKQSLLKKVFSADRLEQLVAAATHSVLVLK